MNINDYPVNFGYLEKTTLSGGVPYTHRGLDYPLNYENVLIMGTKIGVSGETGLAEGPHVHVQAGRDEWAQQTINPTPFVGKPGVVVKTGNGSQWGNYVCIKVGDVNVFYCHLSKINVQVGQEVGDDMEDISLEIGRILYAFAGYDGIRGKPNALAGEMDGEIERATKGQKLSGNYIRSLYQSTAFKDAQKTLGGINAEAMARRAEGSKPVDFEPVTDQLFKKKK